MAGILIVDQIQNSSNTLLINSGALASNTVGTAQLGAVTNINSGSATALTLQTANTTAVTIDTSQNVGIGTASPTAKAQIGDATVVSTNRLVFGKAQTASEGNLPAIGQQSAGTGNDLALASTSTSGAVRFYTGVSTNSGEIGTGSNAERMRIDSSGNVLVGVTTPYSGTVSNFTASTGVDIGLSSTATSKQLQFIRSATTGTAGNIYATAGSFSNYCGIEFVIENVGGGSQAGYLKFNTASSATVSEKMRIGSNGQIYMNTSSAVTPGGPSGQVNILNPNDDGNWALALQNNGTTASRGRGLGVRFNVDFNTNSSEFIYCTGAGNGRFYVTSNGGVYNYQGNNVNLSDRREKTNLTPSKSYLDIICSIPVQTFNYIDQNMEEDGGLTLGVVAQDVQAVAPEFVTEANWGTREEPRMRLAVYETDIKYALMKSIQELKAINDTQAETINTQSTMIASLTSRITALENK